MGYSWCATRQKTEASRNRIFAAIHTRWGQMRPDLKRSSEESREELHRFAEAELRLAVTSLKDLSSQQLCRLLDSMARETTRRPAPGANLVSFPSPNTTISKPRAGEAEVVHLAGESQTWAIDRVFDYIGWGEEARSRFLDNKFRRKNAAHLTPRQAHSCLMILFTVAASKDLKAQGHKRVPRDLAQEYIPKLKEKLGIDQEPF